MINERRFNKGDKVRVTRKGSLWEGMEGVVISTHNCSGGYYHGLLFTGPYHRCSFFSSSLELVHEHKCMMSKE